MKSYTRQDGFSANPPVLTYDFVLVPQHNLILFGRSSTVDTPLVLGAARKWLNSA